MDIVYNPNTSERDKISATTELNKMLGYNAPEKQEVNQTINVSPKKWLK